MHRRRNRLAYIVGNDRYQELSPLQGAVNDAVLMKETLESCGFDSLKYVNLNYEDFRKILYDFKGKCMENKVCLFYYAGHGFEYEGNNYLCPVDATMERIKESNINISNLVNEVSKDRDFVCIVILDCCRNIYTHNERGSRNVKPIAANFKNEGGIYIAYSTSSGKSAMEWDENGLYTKLLCDHISNSNEPIEKIFKDVRKEMLDLCMDKGSEKQISWEYSSLVSEFYFKERVINEDISSIAERAVENACSYAQIIENVDKYCLTHELMDTGEILLKVLNTIDKLMRKREEDK